jgi:hypothetical protein
MRTWTHALVHSWQNIYREIFMAAKSSQRHGMIRPAIILCIIAAGLFFCQNQTTETSSDEPVQISDVLGYWAEYQCITKNDYIGTSGPVKDSTTRNYANDISAVLYFDSTNIQWNRWSNGRNCYTRESPTPYSIDGETFAAYTFTGQQVNGSDTLNITSTIQKAGGELRITTTFLGTWYGGNPTRIDYEYFYSRPIPFPPASWPQVACP